MTEATLTTMYKCFCLSREKHLCVGSCCGILLAVPTFHLAIPGEQITVTPMKHLCSTHSSHCKGTEKLFWYCFMAMAGSFFNVSIPKIQQYHSCFRQIFMHICVWVLSEFPHSHPHNYILNVMEKLWLPKKKKKKEKLGKILWKNWTVCLWETNINPFKSAAREDCQDSRHIYF